MLKILAYPLARAFWYISCILLFIFWGFQAFKEVKEMNGYEKRAREALKEIKAKRKEGQNIDI